MKRKALAVDVNGKITKDRKLVQVKQGSVCRVKSHSAIFVVFM